MEAKNKGTAEHDNNGDTDQDEDYCGGGGGEYGELMNNNYKKKAISPPSAAAVGPGIGAAPRGSSSGGAAACCQAERCGADLSEAKRYHRRHKVCEAHSKAAVVSVSGLRQRFCQQCSRFHELSEFDEAKRSCRRRLAGHNERRRKSSVECYGEGSSAAKITSNKETSTQCINGDGATDPRPKFHITLQGNSQYNKPYHIR